MLKGISVALVSVRALGCSQLTCAVFTGGGEGAIAKVMKIPMCVCCFFNSVLDPSNSDHIAVMLCARAVGSQAVMGVWAQPQSQKYQATPR